MILTILLQAPGGGMNSFVMLAGFGGDVLFLFQAANEKAKRRA